MSIKAKITSDSEIAKSVVMHSTLDDNVKQSLVTFITHAAIATNGISSEEKIQSLTESMASLATTIATFICKTVAKIDTLKAELQKTWPNDKSEQVAIFEHMLTEAEHYRKVHHKQPEFTLDQDTRQTITAAITNKLDEHIKKIMTKNTDEAEAPKNTFDKIFALLEKPYVWIFGCVAFCSPYALDILKAIFAHFSG